MAAILKLRRGSTTPTSLEQSELFYNSTLATIQVGKSSATNDNITLVKLTETNTGNLQIVGTISGSYLTLNNDITASNAYFRGDVRLDGQIILGDVPQDNINVNAQFSGSLIPSASTFDLGSNTKKWNNVYANNINGSVTDSNLLNFTSSINAFTSSQETKNTTLGTYTGSVNSQLTELYSTASNHETRLDLVEGEFSSSLYSKVTSLINHTGSYATTGSNVFTNSQYISGALEIYSSSNAEIRLRNGNLNLDYHIQNTAGGNFSIHNNALGASIFRIDSGSSVTTSHAHFFGDLFVSKSVIAEQAVTAPLITATNLIVNGGSISGSITGIGNVANYSQSIDSRIQSLNGYTSSNDLDITELYSTASNHETRIDGIQDYTSSLRTAIGVNGSNVTINGDLSVLGTTTQINSTQVNIGDNILELNYGGAVTKGGIFISDATGVLTSGSLLWNSVTDRWIAGRSGSESNILLANGDSVVSSSAQINLVDTADYVSAIKNRLNIESVISGSSQVDVLNTTNFTTYSSSVDSKLNQLATDSASQDGRLDNLEAFTSSQQTKNSTLANYTGSNDIMWNVLGSVTASLINATSSYETRGNGIVSGSSQLTASYDLRYANSSSFHNLVGAWDYGIQGSIRDSAFYSVTSSAQLDTGSITSASLNDTFIFTAGATKEYVNWRTEAILNAIAVADITAVAAGNGLTGGGTTGDVTLSLDTNSSTFTDGVKNKLNTDGVISGSSQIVSILLPLNIFSASQETKNTTLATYTGSVDTNLSTLNSFSSSINTTIKTKLDVEGVVSGSSQITIASVSGFNVFSASVDYRLDQLETDTGSQSGRLTALEAFTSSQETKNTTLGTYTGSVDATLTNLNSFSSSINTTIKTKLDVEGVLSGSSQIVNILGPLNAFSASQETKNSTLATYTGSVDSSLSQLNAVSHSHSNKTNLDTINQNLATNSNVTFGSLATSGTGSIGTNLTVYGNLTVFGTQSIINSTNLEVADNMIYLAPTASGDWDLGIVGQYNDGVYKHAGIFSDASDGHAWKVFKDLTAETLGSVDTSHGSFTLADFKAANFTGTSFNGVINSTNGVVSGSSQISGIGNSQLTNNSITIAGTSTALGGSISLATITNGSGIVSGSSQITLASTTGFGTYLNQGVLTTSDVQHNSLGVGMAASATAGRIDATNDIVAYSSSDRRFKDNIKPIENALDKINQIGGYEFDWKEENKIEHGYEGHDLGVIAQEIEAIAPELVQTRENGYKAVKYDKLVSVLIQAVKELSAKVTELENK